LNTFVPQPSMPDPQQLGDLAPNRHRYAIASDSIGISQFSYKRSDADVTANSNCPHQLLIEPTAGDVFDRQHRRGKFVLEF
jgi:hypothetical protein